jgi:peptidyl-prolyl cis-trans isomerase SurA
MRRGRRTAIDRGADLMDSAMPKFSMGASQFRRCLAGAVLFAAAVALPAPSHAQVVVIANGSPITNYDIEQRAKLMMTSSHKKPMRQQVIQELIDERIEIAKAKSYGFEVSQQDIEKAFDNIAARQHIPVKKFIEFLARAGIAPETIKARIKAQMTWSQLVRGKFQASLEVGESDIDRAMRARNESDAQGYVYTLYPITVVIPAGSSAAVIAAKHREAESLQARFINCKDGLAYARALRDVAVREPVTRSSGDLAPQLRDLLGKVEIGRLTSPDTTAQGLQMFAVCNKQPTKTASPIETELRNQIFTRRFDAQAKRYLEELRKSAMIEYKDANGHDVTVKESQ